MPPSIAAATRWSSMALCGGGTARSRWQANLARRQFAIEFGLGHDPVAAGFLRVIERAIAAIDQIRHRLAELKLCNTDGNRDVGKSLSCRAAGDTALRD